MKVCEIVDESRESLSIGYLFYYEKEDVYSIELKDDEDVPVFFSWFVKTGNLTVDPEWSRRWVESRVVPRDRQNLGAILKNSGLKEYDTFRLLMISEGRCAQDDCAVKQVKYETLPEWVIKRRQNKLDFAVRLTGWNMLLVFRNGGVYRVNLHDLAKKQAVRSLSGDQTEKNERLINILGNSDAIDEYDVMAGGAALIISGCVIITAEELLGDAKKIPLSAEELRLVVKSYIMDTKDACDELHCSRQYVDQLTKKSSVLTLKDGGTRIYARSDIKRATE